MYKNVHLKKQNMHENALQSVPAIYLNMALMFEIYRRVPASFSDGSSLEMLPFQVCFSIWDGSVAVEHQHWSGVVCLMLGIS